MSQIWYIEEVDLFHILCPYKFTEHVKHHPSTQYNKGNFLFLPDDKNVEIFLITAGRVKVGTYDDEGNEIVKAYLKRGDVLGELAFLGQQRHRDFAEVVENTTTVCKMSIEKARELARDYVPFSLEIQKRIGENVRRLERRLEILFQKDNRKRLLELIKDLCTMYGKAHGKGTMVDHGLTQQELASLIGLSRKTVSLLLNDLEREGLVKLFWGKMLVYEQVAAMA